MQPHNKSKLPDKSRDQIELHLPDEARNFPLNIQAARCRCNGIPTLQRGLDPDTHKQRFRLACQMRHQFVDGSYADSSSNGLGHDDPTPWFSHSNDAVQHWNVVKALSRL